MAEPGLQRPRVVAGVSQGISVVWLAARDIPRTREAVEAAFDRRRASQLRALVHDVTETELDVAAAGTGG